MSDRTAEPTAPQDLAEEPVERAPWWQRFVTGSSTWIGLILAGLIIVFAGLEYDSFVSASNVRNIFSDAAVLLVLAVGMTYVIITAGIDLSVGAVLVFSGVVSVKFMNAVGGDGWGTILAGLAAALASGLAWGILNGFLVAKAKIPPLIVTLGTLGMALGFALLITGGVDERESDQADRHDRHRKAVRSDPLPGDHLAGSGDRFWDRARRHALQPLHLRDRLQPGGRAASGIAVDRHLIKVYGLAGLLAGLAGFMNVARFSTTTIGGHDTDNLQAIAAVVIGGTSLFGGIGTVLGSVFGVFIPAVLQNGFVIVGVQPFWQQVAIGAVLIGAVYLDQLRRRSHAAEPAGTQQEEVPHAIHIERKALALPAGGDPDVGRRRACRLRRR